MNYFDNVDWEEISKQALEKAIKKAFELVIEGKLPIEDAAIATKILWEEYKKEIWLMGPVPMKKGYKVPTVNMNFLNDL
jgi:hypothetical protein